MVKWTTLLAILAGACLLPVEDFAQTLGRGEITGRVTDQTGAALPGVSVVLRQEETGQTQTNLSNTTGDFAFPFVTPGTYSLSGERRGFARVKLEGVHLIANQQLDFPITLKLGPLSEELTVTTQVNPIETANATVRQSLTEEDIQNLPILMEPGTRSVLQSLLSLTPGASFYNTYKETYSRDLTGKSWSINGSQVGGIGFALDGVNNTALGDPVVGAQTGGPNPDALGEFSVLTHTFKAEAGTQGAIVSLNTKSGGNQFHGQARAIHLNPALVTRDFFDRTGSPPQWRTSAGGVQLAGPIIIPHLYHGQNRTFFFIDTEQNHSKFPYQDQFSLPTAAQRNGDFSALPQDQWPRDPLTGQPFPNGIIPSNRILEQSRFYMDNFVSLPTEGDQWIGTTIYSAIGTQLSARVDHFFSPSNSLSATAFWEDWHQDYLVPPSIDTAERYQGQGLVLSVRHTLGLSPRTTNSFAMGRSYSHPGHLYNSKWINADPSQYGYNIHWQSAGATGFPQAGVGGNGFTPGGGESRYRDAVWTWKNDLASVRGAHAFKMGGEVLWLRGENFDNVGSAPYFGFTRDNPAGTGQDWGDFLLGIPSSYSQGTDSTSAPRRRATSVYIQDDFKWHHNLVLNLGFRYELHGVWTDSDGRSAAFRPGAQSTVFPKAPMGVIFNGDLDPRSGEKLGAGFNPPDHNNFAPRVGLAYSPSSAKGIWGRILGGPGRSSIRAGYGLYYVLSRQSSFGYLQGLPPWSFKTELDGSQIQGSGGNFANPWGNNPNPFPPPADQRSFSVPLGGVPLVDSNLHEPYEHQWTLSLQRQLPQGLSVELSYLGNSGIHLYRSYEANPGRLPPNANVFNVNSRRLYSGFRGIEGFSSDGNSNYNAMQVVVSRRFSSRFQLNSFYVWAKALDNAFGFMDNLENFGKKEGTPWGCSSADRRHQFAFLGIWQMPALRTPKILAPVFSDWEAITNLQLRSGMPLGFRNGYDSTLRCDSLGCDGMPDIVGPFQMLNPREIHTFKIPNGRTRTGNFLFDPTVFRMLMPKSPAEARLGNLGRNVFSGPGINNVDFSLLRNFKIRERHRIQVRADINNLFNHTQFMERGFQTRLINPNFGTTYITRGSRRIQFYLRYSF